VQRDVWAEMKKGLSMSRATNKVGRKEAGPKATEEEKKKAVRTVRHYCKDFPKRAP
jgi:hypothetical protein